MRKPNEQLSARATALLLDCVAFGTNPTVSSLWGRFSEGRGAVETALKELHTCGFVDSKIVKVGNRPQTVKEVTRAGYAYIAQYVTSLLGAINSEGAEFSGSQFLTSIFGELSMHTKSSNLVSKHIEKYSTEAVEEYKTHEIQVVNVPGWNGIFEATSSDDEYLEKEAKRQKYAQAAFEETHRDQQKVLQTDRFKKPKHLWSIPNVAHEFMDRVDGLWSIPPWQSGKTKFIAALGKHRKLHGTNGELEVTMMDLFFTSISHDKFESGEHLWRSWLTRWPALLTQARGIVRTEEQQEAASVQAERSQAKLHG